MKQRKIFALFGALFLLVSSLFSGLFLFLNQGIPMRATDAGTVCPPKTIVLDAGHGGEDSGALGVDGVKEKDLNLQITLILSDLFRAGGYRVILTREDDRLLCDPDTPAGRRKQGDLQNRVRKSAENGSAVLVSIHQNTAGLVFRQPPRVRKHGAGRAGRGTEKSPARQSPKNQKGHFRHLSAPARRDPRHPHRMRISDQSPRMCPVAGSGLSEKTGSRHFLRSVREFSAGLLRRRKLNGIIHP